MACSLYNNNGMGADAEYISKLIQDVTKELKEINRMCEHLMVLDMM